MREASIAEIEKLNLALLILGSIGVIMATRDVMAFFSFVVASAIVTLNFRLLKRIIGKLVLEKTFTKKDLFVTIPLKFLLLLVVLAVVVIYGNVQPFYFLMGVSTILIAILIIQLRPIFGFGGQRRENDGT